MEPYAGVIDRIDELEKLEPGWNSYRAPRIDELARERAKRLVRSFRTSPLVPPPSIAPTPNGGVLLHWDAEDLEIEITFDPTGGTYSVAQVDSPDLLVYGTDLGEGIDEYRKILEPYLVKR